MKRVWVPNTGDCVKLRAFDMYTHLKPDDEIPAPGPWAHLIVDEVTLHEGTPYWVHLHERAETRALDKAEKYGDRLWKGVVGLDQIDRPLGWEPVYEMMCKDRAQAERVVNDWFKRGIEVFPCQDLSCAGRMMYRPVDPETTGKAPHWAYTHMVECVPPELCPKVFTVLYREEGRMGEAPREFCRSREDLLKWERARIKQLRREGWTCKYIPGAWVWNIWKETVLHKAED